MKITGKAHVSGLNGEIAYTGVASPSDQLLSSAGFTKDCEFKEPLIHPGTGERLGGAYAREHIAGDIEFIPVADGTGNTLANAKLALDLPDIPFKVTLSAFDHADLNGDYMCEGPCGITFAPEGGKCRVRMPLVKYTDAGATATILTTVIS